jgi:hypothetical protein
MTDQHGRDDHGPDIPLSPSSMVPICARCGLRFDEHERGGAPGPIRCADGGTYVPQNSPAHQKLILEALEAQGVKFDPETREAYASGKWGFGSLLARPMFPGNERKYLPTLSDLVDRLTIVLQKEIFIDEHRDDYRAELKLIMHDIDLILAERPPLRAEQIKAIVVIQLANAYIWQNETRIRDGNSDEPDAVQLRRLKATHAVNGVRATGKNALAAFDGGRSDHKIDCFSADLIEEFGNWNVFGE